MPELEQLKADEPALLNAVLKDGTGEGLRLAVENSASTKPPNRGCAERERLSVWLGPRSL
jgi:hypothetical protein